MLRVESTEKIAVWAVTSDETEQGLRNREGAIIDCFKQSTGRETAENQDPEQRDNRPPLSSGADKTRWPGFHSTRKGVPHCNSIGLYRLLKAVDGGQGKIAILAANSFLKD
jgi:hypothetical protein